MHCLDALTPPKKGEQYINSGNVKRSTSSSSVPVSVLNFPLESANSILEGVREGCSHVVISNNYIFLSVTKGYLKSLGNSECSPQTFLENSGSLDKLLIIIKNEDIAAHVHKVRSVFFHLFLFWRSVNKHQKHKWHFFTSDLFICWQYLYVLFNYPQCKGFIH